MGVLRYLLLIVVVVGSSFGVSDNPKMPNFQRASLYLGMKDNLGRSFKDDLYYNYCAASGSTIYFANNSVIYTSGGSDFIDCGNSSLVNPSEKFTISFWYRLSSGQGSYFGKMTTASTGYAYSIFRNIDNKIYFAISSAGGAPPYSFTGTYANREWVHVVGTYDGRGATNADKLKTYINGKQVSVSFSGTIPTSANTASSAPLCLNKLNGSTYGTGEQRGAGLWSIAFTPTQVMELYVWETRKYK